MDRIDTLLQFLDDDPADAFTHFALAQEYVKQGDLATGLGYYEALAAEQPDYVGTYYHLAKLYARLDRPDDAAQTIATGIERATAAGDLHARGELQALLIELDLDDDAW